MATHVLQAGWRHASTHRSVGRRAGVLHFCLEHHLALPIGAAVALLWANLWPVSYFTVAHALAFPVNQIAMVFFFGLVAQEVFEETMPGGALHEWRRWVVPIGAAASGLAGAALVYGLWVEWRLEPMLHAGWPLVAGVDIAFAYLVAKTIFRRHPAVAFVLLLALASNVLGFIAVAPHYLSSPGRGGGAAVLMAAAIGVALWLHGRRVRQFWPYIWVAGGLSWLALYLEGFHPALALLPIVPFLPHARRRLDELFADERDARGATPRHFEHVWHYHAQLALLLFGLVNAGVVLNGYGTGTWAALAALLAGRTLGILVGIGVLVAVGLRLPAHVRGREAAVVALAASSGFTFSLFLATTVFPAGPLLAELKLGALLSIAGVPLALVAARVLHVGRYRRQSYANREHAAG